jgi:hypothetical protein
VKWEASDFAPPPTGNAEAERAPADDVIEVRDARRPVPPDPYHPGPETHLLGLRRDLERIGLEAVEWADAATDALRREAEQEAAQIRADAVRRADRLLREVERARMALRSEARLAAARIWESARAPDASLAETIRTADSAFVLPPISWHADAPRNGTAATHGEGRVMSPRPPPAEVPVVVDDDASAGSAVAGTETVVPPVPRFEEMVREPPPTVPPSAPGPAPAAAASGAAPAAGAPPRRLWLGVAAVVVVALLVGWLVTRSDDSVPGTQPAVTTSPPATTLPGAATVNPSTIAGHFTTDLATLAPTGQTVASQGAIRDDSDAATGEFEQLAAALATDRTTGIQGRFAPAAAAGSAAGRAEASVSVYATPEAAARAYDAARGYFLSDRRTGAGNREIAVPSNRALRAFGFEHGTGAERAATAYLQFPGGLVELSTSGAPSGALASMVNVINGWAA